jgi:succinate dehydrogenase / fumarate reductase cytochrome b subunit
MADASRAARPRPLSPHVQIWRWHITMVCSILHRVTGLALYGGALILMAFAVSLASGPDAYATFRGVLGSLLGKIVLFLLTVSVFYHLANGVRHLVWDAGKGFQPKTADQTAFLAIGFALVAAVALWVFAAFAGAL